MATNVWTPTRKVTLRAGDVVTVRELSWPQAMEFLGLVGEHARGFIQSSGGETDRAQIVRGLIEQIPTLAIRAREIGDFLLAHCVESGPTGLESRGVADVLKVLEAAVALNLSTEVLEAASSLGKVIGAAFLTTTNPAPASDPQQQ